MARDIDESRPRIVMGRIGRTHGVQGWVKLKSWTSPADNILEFAGLLVETENGREQLRIAGSRWQGSALLVRFQGYDDPEQAKRLTGLDVVVEASELSALEAGDFYWHQLQGLQVVSVEGENFGRVSHLLETGANDVLVVEPEHGSIDRRRRLIPYVWGQVVRQVNLEAGTVQVDWGADFLE